MLIYIPTFILTFISSCRPADLRVRVHFSSCQPVYLSVRLDVFLSIYLPSLSINLSPATYCILDIYLIMLKTVEVWSIS